MKKRGRYKDIRSVGRSNIIPFKKHEKWADRHKRRHNSNLEYQKILRVWCDKNGYSFEIKNDGQHWLFTKDTEKIEWWPSSAKVIFNQVWSEGIHCHDYMQLIKIIENQVGNNFKHIDKSNTNRFHQPNFKKNESKKLKDWCDNNGYSFEIKNKGMHWILKNTKMRVEWWPTTQKTVFNQNYKDIFLSIDVNQLTELIGMQTLPLS